MKKRKFLSGLVACMMLFGAVQGVMATENKDVTTQEETVQVTAIDENSNLSYCEFVRAVVVEVAGEQPQLMDTHYAMSYMNKAKELGLIGDVPMEKWGEQISAKEQAALLEKLEADQKKAVTEKLNGLTVHTIWVNDKALDLTGLEVPVRNGKVMVPLRKTAEALGFKIKWDGQTSTAFLDNGQVKTQLQLGYDNYYKESSQAIGLTKPIQYGVTPMLINGNVYIPAEFYNLLFSNPETVRVNKGVMSIINK